MKLSEALDQVMSLREANERRMLVIGNSLYSGSKSGDNTKEFSQYMKDYIAKGEELTAFSNQFIQRIREVEEDGISLETMYAERDRLAYICGFLEHVIDASPEVQDKEGGVKYLAIDTKEAEEYYTPLKEELDTLVEHIDEILEREEV